MAVGADKAANLVRAATLVKEAASNGAKVVALPVSIGYRYTLYYTTHTHTHNVS